MIQKFRLKHSLTVLAFVFTATSLSLTSSFTAHAAQQTCVWTGAIDKKFSTPGNWTACNNAAPLAGDIISIDATVLTAEGTTGLKKGFIENDTNLQLAKVVLNNTKNSQTATIYPSLYISKLTLANGGTVEVTGGGDFSFYVGTPGATPEQDTKADLVVKGDFKLVKPLHSSSYNKLVVDGKLTVGTDYSTSYEYYPEKTSFGSLELNGVSMSVYSNSKDLALTKPMILNNVPRLYFTNLDYQTGFNWVVSGSITNVSAEPTQVQVGSGIKLTISGKVSDPTKLVKSNLSEGELIVGSAALEAQARTTEVTGQQPKEFLFVGDKEVATLAEGSSRGRTTVNGGGLLKGIGSLSSLYVMERGTVSPGMSPGCLNTGTLNLSGEYIFELGGVDPCTGYDQIKVTDPAATYESVILNSDTSVLTTARFNGYTPKQGQVFMIIENQGSKAVKGTFKGLPEGTAFEQNGVTFKISYVGGNGNDITLTVQNVPVAPDTGFELIRTNPMLVAFIAVASALVLTVVGRQLAIKR